MFMLTSLHTKACRKNVTWFSKTKHVKRLCCVYFPAFCCNVFSSVFTAKVEGRSVSHIFIVINNIITIQHVCVVLFACSMLNKPCLQKKINFQKNTSADNSTKYDVVRIEWTFLNFDFHFITYRERGWWSSKSKTIK